jgi:hypothetical protein
MINYKTYKLKAKPRIKAQMKRTTCTNETIKNIMKRNKWGPSKPTILNVPLVWFFLFVMRVCINNNNCKHQHGSALS